jgi:NAD(P)-dependent dehydrogenase (short-subunit alcohol dehydrogenase family)
MSPMTRIALITGANRGLGFEAARQLGALGMTTLIGSRDAAKGERAAAELRGDGRDAIALRIDVDSEPSVQEAAAQVAQQYGRLDVLVNNAGDPPGSDR